MAEIIKVEKETMPTVKLIGKKYGNGDRDARGSYAAKWGEWFEKDWFSPLKSCKGVEGVSEDFLGVMRENGGVFEYWIGMFMSPADTIPEGYESVEIGAGEIGVCYVYGKDGPELYGMDTWNACMAAWKERDWPIAEDAWYIERYNCPRFTTPDEKGNIILDVCVYLTDAGE